VSSRPTLAEDRGPETQGSLTVLASDGKTIEDGSIVDRGQEVMFRVETRGTPYLYLLRKSNEEALEVLWPPTGLIWMATPEAQTIIPQAPSIRAGDEHSPSWNPESAGPSEFLLVGAGAPRDVPQDGRTASLERFLLPPAFVRGPAARAAVVLARTSVTWEQDEGAGDPPDEDSD